MSARQGAKWIWYPNFRDHDEVLPGRFVLFRKVVNLKAIPSTPCLVNVSADTRYRLFVNDKSVAFGPCKSYPTRWYYETVDLQPFLRLGQNVISAKVLRFFPNQIGSSSLIRASLPGFILWGQVGDISLITDESWFCTEDKAISLQPRSEWNYILGPPFLSLDERVDFEKSIPEWKSADLDVTKWSSAVNACPPTKMMPAMEPWKLYERPIPHLPEVPREFECAVKSMGSVGIDSWNRLLHAAEGVQIGAYETITVDFESHVLTTGFLDYNFIGGADAEVSILYSECYEKDLNTDCAPFPLPRSKGNRRDYENGRLYGTEDHVKLSAIQDVLTRYEPFWFRTFRFVQLKITTKSVPLTVQRISYRETHYPLEISTKLQLGPRESQTWDMCLNTLRNCMHETYEDCPFYEQNQFAMDGRLQLLFTYQLSRDDRLARKTIHEFHASRRDDGLLETNFPVSFRAINIPQFSLYWILMLYDHMMYFGDGSLIRRYISTADGVLSYFDDLINADGLVGVFEPECWAFVDWVKEWQGKKGIRDMAVPPIYKSTGVAAYNSLIYAVTLNRAADLADFINRKDTATEYRARAFSLNTAVYNHCYNPDLDLFTDGPGTSDVSEHTQIFAILSGAITGPEATALLKRTMDAPVSSMPRCSFAMKHYVFRALEKTGLYEEYFECMMQPWQAMIENNLTTCPEDDVSHRSDCHGWSASPIYEFVAVLHGIRPDEPGLNNLRVRPMRDLLGRARARYTLPNRAIEVQWEDHGDIQVRGVGQDEQTLNGLSAK